MLYYVHFSMFWAYSVLTYGLMACIVMGIVSNTASDKPDEQ